MSWSRLESVLLAVFVACLAVVPFVVPFVPISGTPLEHHPAPNAAFMVEIYTAVAQQLAASDLRAAAMSAGCAKCGACSALSLFEQAATTSDAPPAPPAPGCGRSIP